MLVRVEIILQYIRYNRNDPPLLKLQQFIMRNLIDTPTPVTSKYAKKQSNCVSLYLRNKTYLS